MFVVECIAFYKICYKIKSIRTAKQKKNPVQTKKEKKRGEEEANKHEKEYRCEIVKIHVSMAH